VPCKDGSISTFNGRWSTESKEDLRVLVFIKFKVNNDIDFEVLTNYSNDWFKSRGKLPINSIIQHVEKNHSLVSYAHLIVA
jgi:hypothetical protein